MRGGRGRKGSEGGGGGGRGGRRRREKRWEEEGRKQRGKGREEGVIIAGRG